MNKVKTQHYVPRFYLKHFTCSDKKVFVYDKNTDKIYNTAVENIACENYFYDSDEIENTQQEEQYLEKYYSSIESEFAPFYSNFVSKLETKEKDLISEEDKNIIADFLVLQIDRTKEHREMSKQSYDTLKKQLLEKGFLKSQLVSMGFDLESPNPKDLHIESILMGNDKRETFSEILKNHIWLIIENKTNQPFFTTDSPVAKYAHIKDEFISYDGYACEGIEIIFPLNSKYLLTLREREHFKNLEEKENSKMSISSIENVDYFNSIEITRCYRQVYSVENKFEVIMELKKINPESFNINRKRIE